MKTVAALAACLWLAWQNVLLRSPLVPPKALSGPGLAEQRVPDALLNASSRASGIAPEALMGEACHGDKQQPARCASPWRDGVFLHKRQDIRLDVAYGVSKKHQSAGELVVRSAGIESG